MKRSSNKAASVNAPLSRLMANIGGPRTWRQRLIYIVNFILLHGLEVFADYLLMDKYSRRIKTYKGKEH